MQTGNNFAMLSKAPKPVRPHQLLSLKQFRDSDWVRGLRASAPISFDIEANSKNTRDEDFYMRCFAVADDRAVLAVDCLNCADEDWQWVTNWLTEQRLIVYNMLYEVTALYRLTGKFVSPHADLFMLMKFLGGPEFSDNVMYYSLKTAQVDILGWEHANDEALYEYMKANKLYWDKVREIDWEILGKYNALDADATWSLYEYFKEFFNTYADSWGSHTATWHIEDCITAGMLQVESIMAGLKIDGEAFDSYEIECTDTKAKSKDNFLNLPALKPHVDEYNKVYIENIVLNEPKTKYTKEGTPAKTWESWKKRVADSQGKNFFNIQSRQQLVWLLYEKAGLKPLKWGKTGPSVDKESQQSLGEPGQLLLKYTHYKNELKFLDQLKANNKAGRLHPKVVFPGTDTGRVVSKEEIYE